jgi:hypothetical protein
VTTGHDQSHTNYQRRAWPAGPPAPRTATQCSRSAPTATPHETIYDAHTAMSGLGLVSDQLVLEVQTSGGDRRGRRPGGDTPGALAIAEGRMSGLQDPWPIVACEDRGSTTHIDTDRPAVVPPRTGIMRVIPDIGLLRSVILVSGQQRDRGPVSAVGLCLVRFGVERSRRRGQRCRCWVGVGRADPRRR